MPVDSSVKLDSLVKILSQLDKGTRITATFLAKTIGVTDRTIYRYMTTLQHAGYPIYFDRKKMSYRFVDGFLLKQDENQTEIFHTLDLKNRILGSTPVGILTYDSTGQCVVANQAAASIAGGSCEQLLSQNYLKLESWKKAGMLKMALDVMQTGVVSSQELLLCSTFGKEVWLHCNMSRFTRNGKNFLLLVTQDFTERKRMEQSLKDSEEMLRLFVEYNPSYTFIKDEELKLVQVSKNYEQLLGKSMDQIIGKSMTELFPKDFAEKLIREDLAIIASGQKHEIEEELFGRFYSTIKFPFERGGKKYLAGFAIDITDRKTRTEQF